MAGLQGDPQKTLQVTKRVAIKPKSFLIGVAGGTASGKTSVCEHIMKDLGQHEVERTKQRVVTISLECFYRQLTDEEFIQANNQKFDFDHPDALDKDLMLSTLRRIQEGQVVKIQEYDFKTNSKKPNHKVIYPADVVFVEGILTFYYKDIRELFDMKLFVDTDSDTRLSRRVMRDVKELKRNLVETLNHYVDFVKPDFEEFCLPTKKYADVIIPRGAANLVAIELIVQHIQDLLRPNQQRVKIKRLRTSSESLVSRPH